MTTRKMMVIPPLAHKAAKIVGVGHRTVQRASFVKKHDPELLKKIESGEITANAGAEIVKKAKPSKPITNPFDVDRLPPGR